MRSDKPSDEQIAFVFDEIATGVAAIEAELAKAGGKDKPKRAPRARKEFGTHLERVEIVIEPEVPPGCEGLEKVLIGENVSRRLDVTPAKFSWRRSWIALTSPMFMPHTATPSNTFEC